MKANIPAVPLTNVHLTGLARDLKARADAGRPIRIGVIGSGEISDPRNARSDFQSPVLFADSHAAMHNFSPSLQGDYLHPYEATRQWMWYKAIETPVRP